MTPAQASQKLRSLPHLSSIPTFPPKDIELRQSLIAIVEGGCRHPAYVRERDKLIPQASRWADAKTVAPVDGDHAAYCREWSGHYLAQMDELAKGIRL
jgi:hypothetical protein